MKALELRGLTKRFGDTEAVQGVDLDVPVGSWFGLVGPSGAGKTTALAMAVGLLHPDQGTSQVFGLDMWTRPDEAKALIGVLPDAGSLPQHLTGSEVLGYLGLLRGLDPDVMAARRAELLRVMDLEHAANTLVSNYSSGMHKKLGLSTALMHGPRLLVLDEPFESIDPVSAGTVRAILRDFVAKGGTVLMSSHVMALVEQVCDRVAVLASGRIVTSGPIDDVRGDRTLEAAFGELVGAGAVVGGLSWFGAGS